MNNITPFQWHQRFVAIASTTAALWGLGLNTRPVRMSEIARQADAARLAQRNRK
ncbi:MAG: hypothetical protein JWP96_155 [Polaromonas sp.]|nr:hypothetical protein [Polaromonas sp.]